MKAENRLNNYSLGIVSQCKSRNYQAIFGLRLGVGILPIAFLVFAFIALYFYPLHGKKLKQVKSDLNRIHKKRK
ncbi:MAG: hypothetical protein KAS63_06940 [Candidatus Heimdallarchaeota archaeon]|nr:hypothetical protein [Candidatus Heimdallarchaeota archaeon]MCK4955081.1 hypothetical protein [Candidatus Heimdallarchaeota archaeon]